MISTTLRVLISIVIFAVGIAATGFIFAARLPWAPILSLATLAGFNLAAVVIWSKLK